MLRTFYNWLIYGSREEEPSENIEFLKGLHPISEAKNETVD